MFSPGQVNYFSDAGLYANHRYGDNLLQTGFFDQLLGQAGSYQDQRLLFEARTRQAINTYGTQVMMATLSMPLNVIGALELAAGAATYAAASYIGRRLATGGVKEVAKTSSQILNTTTRQLQAKFKHAADFGVTGSWNKAAAGRFNSAINQHINSAGVKTINGTYRGQSVIHHLNPNTGLNVISSPSGQFISGWKLNPAQLQNVLKHGGL